MKTLIRGLAAVVLAVTLSAAGAAPKPRLLRLEIATIGAADPHQVAAQYQQWLGFVARGEGTISNDLAQSWGAPAMAGRPYALVGPRNEPGSLIRIVKVDTTPGYRAMSTAGWNAAELMVDDIAATYAKLQGSPFRAAAPPAAGVQMYPTIKSMHVEGPAHEMLFMTSETGDRAKSILEVPRDPISRPFVAWTNGPDVLAIRDWYAHSFDMKVIPGAEKPIPGEPGRTMPNVVLLMREPHNLVQFEGNPEQFAPRKVAAGQLPEGNAMASFTVDSLDGLPVKFIAPPRKLYGERRAATTLDPAGNRVELIEAQARP